MSNTELSYCVTCKKTTSFYNVELDTWECEECGHTISEDELGNTETDYPEDEDAFDEEFETEGTFEDDTDDNFEDDIDEDFDKDFDVKGTF